MGAAAPLHEAHQPPAEYASKISIKNLLLYTIILKRGLESIRPDISVLIFPVSNVVSASITPRYLTPAFPQRSLGATYRKLE